MYSSDCKHFAATTWICSINVGGGFLAVCRRVATPSSCVLVSHRRRAFYRNTNIYREGLPWNLPLRNLVPSKSDVLYPFHAGDK